MKYSKFSYLFLWLFFSGLLLAGMIAAAFLGYWHKIPQMDKTYFSFLIIFVFVIGWLYSLIDIVWLTRFVSRGVIPNRVDFEDEVVVKDERTHFFLDILPAMGFMGTLIGMLIILTALRSAITAESNLAGLKSLILEAISGLSPAALTTVIGLTGYIFLKLFHAIFRDACLKFLSKTRSENENRRE